jgi:hypothetical protein
MSLLQDIQNECTEKDASVSRLLRLCLRLAAALKNEPLKTWVTHELNGYPDNAPLPSYRVFPVSSSGYFTGPFGSSATLQISVSVLPKESQDGYRFARLNQPIAQYESLIQGENSSVGQFQIPWPIWLAVKYASKMTRDMQCIQAWQNLPAPGIFGLIDTIKTRVLQMAIEIEANDPNAGEVLSIPPNIKDSTVNQIINNTIIGSQIQNVAVGLGGITQSASEQVKSGDLASLAAFLERIGIPGDDIAALSVAVTEDKTEGNPGIGAKALGWLSKFSKAAVEAGGKETAEVVVNQVKEAITAYLT